MMSLPHKNSCEAASEPIIEILVKSIEKIRMQKQRPNLERIYLLVSKLHPEMTMNDVSRELDGAIKNGLVVLLVHNRACSYRVTSKFQKRTLLLKTQNRKSIANAVVSLFTEPDHFYSLDDLENRIADEYSVEKCNGENLKQVILQACLELTKQKRLKFEGELFMKPLKKLCCGTKSDEKKQKAKRDLSCFDKCSVSLEKINRSDLNSVGETKSLDLNFAELKESESGETTNSGSKESRINVDNEKKCLDQKPKLGDEDGSEVTSNEKSQQTKNKKRCRNLQLAFLFDSLTDFFTATGERNTLTSKNTRQQCDRAAPKSTSSDHNNKNPDQTRLVKRKSRVINSCKSSKTSVKPYMAICKLKSKPLKSQDAASGFKINDSKVKKKISLSPESNRTHHHGRGMSKISDKTYQISKNSKRVPTLAYKNVKSRRVGLKQKEQDSSSKAIQNKITSGKNSKCLEKKSANVLVNHKKCEYWPVLKKNQISRKSTQSMKDGHAQKDGLIPHIPSITDKDNKLFARTQEIIQQRCSSADETVRRSICVAFGRYELSCRMLIPYLTEYSSLSKLFLCEFCISYLRSASILQRHLLKCKFRHPPSDEIYRNQDLSVFEMNGWTCPVYSQNLIQFARLLLDHPGLHIPVYKCLFYLLTIRDRSGCHLVGFYSCEASVDRKHSLLYLLVLPQYRGQGYGTLLVNLSYHLSHMEHHTGSPHPPLSNSAATLFQSFWTSAVVNHAVNTQYKPFTINDISTKTGICYEDVLATLQHLQLVSGSITNDETIVLSTLHLDTIFENRKPNNYTFNFDPKFIQRNSSTNHRRALTQNSQVEPSRPRVKRPGLPLPSSKQTEPSPKLRRLDCIRTSVRTAAKIKTTATELPAQKMRKQEMSEDELSNEGLSDPVDQELFKTPMAGHQTSSPIIEVMDDKSANKSVEMSKSIASELNFDVHEKDCGENIEKSSEGYGKVGKENDKSIASDLEMPQLDEQSWGDGLNRSVSSPPDITQENGDASPATSELEVAVASCLNDHEIDCNIGKEGDQDDDMWPTCDEEKVESVPEVNRVSPEEYHERLDDHEMREMERGLNEAVEFCKQDAVRSVESAGSGHFSRQDAVRSVESTGSGHFSKQDAVLSVESTGSGHFSKQDAVRSVESTGSGHFSKQDAVRSVESTGSGHYSKQDAVRSVESTGSGHFSKQDAVRSVESTGSGHFSKEDELKNIKKDSIQSVDHVGLANENEIQTEGFPNYSDSLKRNFITNGSKHFPSSVGAQLTPKTDANAMQARTDETKVITFKKNLPPERNFSEMLEINKFRMNNNDNRTFANASAAGKEQNFGSSDVVLHKTKHGRSAAQDAMIQHSTTSAEYTARVNALSNRLNGQGCVMMNPNSKASEAMSSFSSQLSNNMSSCHSDSHMNSAVKSCINTSGTNCRMNEPVSQRISNSGNFSHNPNQSEINLQSFMESQTSCSQHLSQLNRSIHNSTASSKSLCRTISGRSNVHANASNNNFAQQNLNLSNKFNKRSQSPMRNAASPSPMHNAAKSSNVLAAGDHSSLLNAIYGLPNMSPGMDFPASFHSRAVIPSPLDRSSRPYSRHLPPANVLHEFESCSSPKPASSNSCQLQNRNVGGGGNGGGQSQKNSRSSHGGQRDELSHQASAMLFQQQQAYLNPAATYLAKLHQFTELNPFQSPYAMAFPANVSPSPIDMTLPVQASSQRNQTPTPRQHGKQTSSSQRGSTTSLPSVDASVSPGCDVLSSYKVLNFPGYPVQPPISTSFIHQGGSVPVMNMHGQSGNFIQSGPNSAMRAAYNYINGHLSPEGFNMNLNDLIRR